MPLLLPQNMLPALTLQVGAPTGGVAWSPDGSRIAAYSNYGRVVTLWRGDGQQLTVLHRDVSYIGNSLSFLPSGKQLVTPTANDAAEKAASLTVWDLERHAEIHTVQGPAPGKPVQYNRAIAFALSPSGEELAAITSPLPGQPLTIYRTSDWTQTGSLPLPPGDAALSIAFSPDGRLIGVGTVQGRIMLSETSAISRPAQIIVAYQSPLMGVESLAFSPDSRLLATGGGLALGNEASEPKLYPLKIWNVADGKLAAEFSGAFSPVREVSWSADGAIVAAAAGDLTLRLFDVEHAESDQASSDQASSGQAIELHNPVMGVRFSPDGHHIAASSGNAVLIFDLNR